MLSSSPDVEDTEAVINNVQKKGKKVTFSFAPFPFRDVEWTVKEVIVMYDGDHFMRKYLEISVPDDQKTEAAIDYIDLESMAANASDVTWTIPTSAGGIVHMDQFKANLGQPVYIQGMFFGYEFPAADNEIVNRTGYIRYYTGKTFDRMRQDNQLTSDGKYEVTGACLEWAEKNYHMLKNAKMFGASPNSNTFLGGSSDGANNPYGFACFDGTDGILSLRNPASSAKDIRFTFDRTIDVPEDAGELKYHIEHSYNLTEGTKTSDTLSYGQSYTFTLQPDEVRILQISKGGDTTKPEISRAYYEGSGKIAIKFNEKVKIGTFSINGASIPAASVAMGAGKRTVHLTMPNLSLQKGAEVQVTAEGIRDLAGNPLEDNEISIRYYPENDVAGSESAVKEETVWVQKEDSLSGNNGFTVTAEIAAVSSGKIISQGSEYELGIHEDGTAYFSLNGEAAVSKKKVNDGKIHMITGVKENNGILKLYIDRELEGAAYKQENRYYKVEKNDITIGNDDFYGYVKAGISDIAAGYDVIKPEIIPAGRKNCQRS